jgi:hypothetical protein
MTKVKIMLSAIAALATVGGAFALKAKKVGSKALYVSRAHNADAPVGQEYCTLTLSNVGTAYEIRPTVPAGFSYFYITETAPIGNAQDLCTYKYYTTQS